MSENKKNTIKKLDALSFNGLDALGIDWRTLVNKDKNLEKEYLKYLELKSNYIIVNLDFSQLEIYVLASLSGDKKLISAVNSGLDIHSFNCEQVFHLNYSQLEINLKKAKTEEEKKEAETMLKDFKAKRKTIKALTFSLSYGASKEKISMDLRISLQEAEKLINDFYTTYPAIRKWQGDTLLKAIQLGYLETPFGRRRATVKLHGRQDAYSCFIKEDKKIISKLKHESEYWSLRNEFKQVLNSNIQSVASDMCSLAACKFKDWLKTANKRAEMYFWIHDSIVLAVHIDDAVLVIDKLRDIMENQVKYPGDPVNYRASLEVGYNYEWTSEIERKDWINSQDKKALILDKLNEAIDLDKKKKFKLIVKSSSLEMDEKYLKNIKMSKEVYFEKLCEKLNIDGVYDPESYMCVMNDCTIDEYQNAMNLDEDDDGEDTE